MSADDFQRPKLRDGWKEDGNRLVASFVGGPHVTMAHVERGNRTLLVETHCAVPWDQLWAWLGEPEEENLNVDPQALDRLLGGMHLRAMGEGVDAEQASIYHSGNISHARLEALCMAAMDDTVFAAVVQNRARLKSKSS